jgi:tetratricopeptide (TPR) repeat protein
VDSGTIFSIVFDTSGDRLIAPVWNAPVSSLRVWDASALPAHAHAFDAVVRLMGEDRNWDKPKLIDRLNADPSLADDLRRAALAIVESWPEDSESLNESSWRVVADPTQSTEAYRRALAEVEHAMQIGPDNAWIENTLGVAQYRVGQYAEAKATLARTTEANADPQKGPIPADVAFLAMACQQLGEKEQAREHLAKLRVQVKAFASPENEDFLHEAEALIEPAKAAANTK